MFLLGFGVGFLIAGLIFTSSIQEKKIKRYPKNRRLKVSRETMKNLN